MTPMPPPLPEITRFDPAAHRLGAFRCGVEDVDEFFYPHEGHTYRFVWEQRVGDILVAAVGERVVGVVAYAASHLPPAAAAVIVGDFRRLGRKKPMEMGQVPSVRIIILGVAPDHRRRGIGAALVRRALDAVTAPVYYLVPQPGSEVFYESLGFVRISAGMRTLMVKTFPVRELPPW